MPERHTRGAGARGDEPPRRGPDQGLGPGGREHRLLPAPDVRPAFNTAIVNGFNALFGDKKKLGSWQSYLEMRGAIVEANNGVRHLLSKVLGAFAGLLFEIGAGRLVVGGNVESVLAEGKARAEKAARARHEDVLAERREESEHTKIQYLLIKVGRALGYDVYVARNDRNRSCEGQSFSMLTVPELPPTDWPPEVRETVSLIDVIWLARGTGEVVCAFEVEKSTSIYSGILRLEDLARSLPADATPLFIVAPDAREREVMAQLNRPAFREELANISLSYIPFGDLCEHCDALCKFGEDHTILRKIARDSR